MQNPNTSFENPYVGPRAFEAEDRANFFGRDAEIRQLADLVVAQRAVLIYSPSGAGKTSLINAGLVPALARRRMTVLPVARVGGSAPPEADNPFVFNVLASLAGETVAPDALLPLSLREGLAPDSPLLTEQPKPGARLLILDQFEELFTLHPSAHAAREDFFAQLQAAFQNDPRLGVLLAMREEYIAYLDTFSAMLPDRLRTRFRLTLLDAQAAQLAIQAPAARQGVDFTDAAARKLVDDLRQVREQDLDGITTTRLGQVVEPVQLQVVCRQIWDHIIPPIVTVGARHSPSHPSQNTVTVGARHSPSGPILTPPPDSVPSTTPPPSVAVPRPTIHPADIETIGDVDTALAAYYASSVARAAAMTGTRERVVREWCEQHLLTPQGVRALVLHGTGLAPAVVAHLENAHLIRAEKRAGATWYELVHDRLVMPLRSDNDAWFKANLSLLQRQAALWEAQKRPSSLLLGSAKLVEAANWAGEHTDEMLEIEREFLSACYDANMSQLQRQAVLWEAQKRPARMLLSGDALMEADNWARNHADEMLAIERDFLQACHSEVERITRERQQNRRIRWLAAGATVFAVLAIVFAVLAIVLMFITWAQLQQVADAKKDTEHSRATAVAEAEVRATAQMEAEDAQATAVAARDAAQRQLDINAARETRARAELALETNAECGLALAVDAYEQAVTIPDVAPAPFADTARAALYATRVLSTLTGHEGPVMAVVASPDGRWLASGGYDTTVRIWDAATGALHQTLTEHTNIVLALAWRPDGEQLASANGSDGILLWDTSTWQVTEQLTEHQATIRALAYSPDGTLLASASDDRTARVWNATTGALRQTLAGHTDRVYAVAWDPEAGGQDGTRGYRLVTGSRDNTLRLWHIADDGTGDGQAHHTWRAASVITSLAWQRGENALLVAGLSDGSLQFFDPAVGAGEQSTADAADADGQPLATVTAHQGWVNALAFDPTGRVLLSAGEDFVLRRWPMPAARADLPLLRGAALTGHSATVRSVAWVPGGIGPAAETWASAGDDGTVRLWRADAGAALARRTPDAAYLYAVAWGDGGWLATAAATAQLYNRHFIDLWQPATGASRRIATQHRSSIWSLAWDAGGRYLATGSADGSARVYDGASGEELYTLTGHEGEIPAVAWAPSTDTTQLPMLASASYDTNVILWDVAAEHGTPLRGHRNRVNGVVWAPTAPLRLASASSDGTVRLWDVATRETTRVLDAGTGLNKVAWSHDGRWVAAGAWDGRVFVWDVGAEGDTSPMVLTGHTAGVTAIAFAPTAENAALLATASRDGTARLWDVTTGESVAVLPGHTGALDGVAWRPDGQRVATVGDDGILIHYADFAHDLLPLAQAQVANGLTPEELAACLGAE